MIDFRYSIRNVKIRAYCLTHINQFQVSVSFLYPPKIWEKQRFSDVFRQRFSDVFRGYRKVTLAWNGLKNRFSSECILRVLWALIYYLCPEGIFLSNNLNQCSFKYFLSILIIQQREGFPLTMFHIKLSELSHEH